MKCTKQRTQLKYRRPAKPVLKRAASAYTLAEVMVSMAILGFMVVSLYAGFSSGFAVVRIARENLRATQILAERMEVIRLIRWSDVTPGFIPTTFQAPFYASDPTNRAQGDFIYSGTVTIAGAPFTDETYATNMHLITINLSWNSGGLTRNRQMNTLVSQYGIQNYIY